MSDDNRLPNQPAIKGWSIGYWHYGDGRKIYGDPKDVASAVARGSAIRICWWQEKYQTYVLPAYFHTFSYEKDGKTLYGVSAMASFAVCDDMIGLLPGSIDPKDPDHENMDVPYKKYWPYARFKQSTKDAGSEAESMQVIFNTTGYTSVKKTKRSTPTDYNISELVDPTEEIIWFVENDE